MEYLGDAYERNPTKPPETQERLTFQYPYRGKEDPYGPEDKGLHLHEGVVKAIVQEKLPATPLQK